MKILFCNFEYPPLGGGGGVVVAALARELARSHDVTVLTSGMQRLPAQHVEDGVRVLRVPVLFRRYLAVANLPSMFAYLPSAAWRAARMRRGGARFDVVNTHFAVPTGPVGQWIANRYDVPNVLSVHGGDLYDPSKRMSPHRHFWLRQPIRAMLRRADAVVAQSNDTLGQLERLYDVHRSVDLIPLGIGRPPRYEATPRCELGLPEDALVLVSVGRLVRRKQNSQLVAALARSGVPHAHLLVIGSGPDEDSVRRAAAEHGVADRVHMLGQVSEAAKFGALAAADVFASTSQHEGFGLVFLEAMACGLPVICYDNGGQTDFLETGTTGHVVPLNDVEQFAAAIRLMSHSRAGCHDIGKANLRRVEAFFIDQCAARYEAVFERTLAAHGRT